MDTSNGTVLSHSRKRDFRSVGVVAALSYPMHTSLTYLLSDICQQAAHNLLLKRDDQYNLRLNASDKCQLYLSRIYENALSTTHNGLFTALDAHLSVALTSCFSSSAHTAGAGLCDIVTVSTGTVYCST